MADKKEIIDKLLLEMLDLVEKEVQCKLNIERRMNEGQLLMAKARYIQGTQTVSQAQLPTENFKSFHALATVIEKPENDDVLQKNIRELKKFPIDKNNSYHDPTNWFGVLVPRSLQLAKERFQNTIELIVECSNIQYKLNNVISYIYKLKSMNS